jgi:trigger factor
MYAEVARRKALAAVLEKATVVDTAGQKVDLNEVTSTDVASQLFEGGHEGHDHGDHEGHDHA